MSFFFCDMMIPWWRFDIFSWMDLELAAIFFSLDIYHLNSIQNAHFLILLPNQTFSHLHDSCPWTHPFRVQPHKDTFGH
jgi:hypothetical protein